LKINVQDKNDNPPVLSTTTYTANIPENQTIGTVINNLNIYLSHTLCFRTLLTKICLYFFYNDKHVLSVSIKVCFHERVAMFSNMHASMNV